MASRPRIRLGILFGGRSAEHEVSLTSAASVISALDPDEFEVIAMGITKHGKLASTGEVRSMLPPHLRDRVDLFDAPVSRNWRMRLISGSGGDGNDSRATPEIIFPLLHGPYGEDGTIQGLLEIAGLPYIGCGVLASAVGMDKDMMKRLFIQGGLPTTPYKLVTAQALKRGTDSIRLEVESDLGYPVFSKPANLGSSVGVVKIHDAAEFEEGLRLSAQFDSKILIEKGIDARELECAILGNDDPEASGVGEVVPSREFYDYKAKYDDPDSRVQIPADIPEEVAEEVRRLAIAAFKCIDGSGLARVDFFLERRTGKIWVNEINTMPGFTPISMYPKLWQARGVDLAELVVRLVRLGMERHRERSERQVS